MSATRGQRPADAETVPQIPQSTPSLAMGMPGHDFTLQAVMELQKSVGELSANVQAMKASVDGVKSKVDDLVGWKHKIIGGVAVMGLVVTVLVFILGRASEYVTFKAPAAHPTPPPAATQPAK